MNDLSPQLRQYYRRREYAIQKLGGACAVCGAIEGLELDHKEKDKKSFSISRCYSLRKELFEAELVKCQLLCNACHKEKNKTDNGVAEHGKYSMYRHHGCRCDLCKQAAKENQRQFRKKKKSEARGEAVERTGL